MFHDEVLSEEQQMIRKVVSQLAKDYPNAYFLKKMRADQFPQEFFTALAENGFLGLEVQDTHGGSGFGLAELLILLYSLGLGGMASYHLLGQFLSAFTLSAHASGAQQAAHLPGLVQGRRWVTAMVEDVTGSDPWACATTAQAAGDRFVLNGRKLCVPCGGEVDYLLVAARTGAHVSVQSESGIGVYIVDAKADGVSIHERELSVRVADKREARSLTGDVFTDIVLKNVRVPREALIGTADGVVAKDMLGRSLLMLAAAAAGWGDRVIDQAVAYANQRVIFSDPISSYQAIQHPMVRAKTDVEMAKLLIERAVHGFTETTSSDDRLSYAANAKYLATEAAFNSCDIAIQAHGGSGFDREVGIITLWPLVLMSRMTPLNSDVILERFGERLVATA